MRSKHPAAQPAPAESQQLLNALPAASHGPERLRLLRGMLWPLCPSFGTHRKEPACAADAAIASPMLVSDPERAFSRLGYSCMPCPPAPKQSLPALAFCLIEKSSLTASKAAMSDASPSMVGFCTLRAPNGRAITSLCSVG